MAVTRRKTVKRGPNKGDVIIAKAKSKRDMEKGNWWPVRVVRDKGSNSTPRNNSGVKFGRKK